MSQPVMTVDSWLVNLGLPCYMPHFSQVNSLDAVARLTPDDLKSLGITVPAHHKALLSGILALREHIHANIAEGFLV